MHTPRQHDAADVSLRLVFGPEYSDLHSEVQQELVREDYLDAFDEDGCTVGEYRRRIGKGNLQAYADCLSVSHK